jgi:hypothetical protein
MTSPANYTIRNQYYQAEVNQCETVWEYVVEMSRIKHLMRGAERVLATFGSFEVVGKLVVYSNYRGTASEVREDIDNGGFSLITSEFLDDMRDLAAGNVDVMY